MDDETGRDRIHAGDTDVLHRTPRAVLAGGGCPLRLRPPPSPPPSDYSTSPPSQVSRLAGSCGSTASRRPPSTDGSTPPDCAPWVRRLPWPRCADSTGRAVLQRPDRDPRVRPRRRPAIRRAQAQGPRCFALRALHPSGPSRASRHRRELATAADVGRRAHPRRESPTDLIGHNAVVSPGCQAAAVDIARKYGHRPSPSLAAARHLEPTAADGTWSAPTSARRLRPDRAPGPWPSKVPDVGATSA